jgi:hypothetical protein
MDMPRHYTDADFDILNHETYINGSTFDYTSLNDAKTRAVNSKSKILNLGSNRTFNIGANTIDFSGLIVKGNNVVIQGGGVTVATASGTIGTYTAITSDVVRGGKSIDSTLAASLQAGDLVKIKSNAYFSAAETDRVQGEMHIVQSVSGNTITFTDTLFDSYTVANGTVIAKVTPTRLSISEGIKIRNTGSGSADNGLTITYAYKPIVKCSFEKCGYASLSITDCYAPETDVIVNDSSYAGTTTSYGVVINNATMYANTKGTINFCRHCVAHGGNTSGGVAWVSRVEVNASANPDIVGNAVLDAHGSTGSVYFINCRADNSIIGIKANARYNYIKNCMGKTSLSGAEFVVVSSTSGNLVDTLEVDGLTLEGYDWGVETSQTVKNLTCKNIKGKGGVSIRADVTKWDFSDMDVEEMGVHVYASAINVPDTLRVTNIKGNYPNLAIANTSAYLLYNESPTIKNISMANCSQRRLAILCRTLTALDSLEFYNCHSVESYSAHIYFSGVTVTRLVISGGTWKDNQRNGTTWGNLLRGNVTTATIQGITTSGVNMVAILYGTIGTLMHFGNNFHNVPIVVTSTPLQVLGGSLGYGMIMAGVGTPEGVVIAGVGAMYFRTDGGAGTTQYTKESGTGNTGWVAK